MFIDAFRITSPLFAAFSLGVLTMAAASAVPESVPSQPVAVLAQPVALERDISVPAEAGVQVPDAQAEPAPTF